ncbi:MAG TPA: hypothetical protein VIY66_01570 [Candidatus Acidoferrales bacterium]
MLAIVTLAPLALPALPGANVTINVVDCPGIRIVPPETPLALKLAPLTFTLDTFMLKFPVFVNVVLKDLLLPGVTVPKFKLAGLTPSEVLAAEPVPVTPITSGEGTPFVTNVIEPLIAEVEVGANTALNVALEFGAIVVDIDSPVRPTPAPLPANCEKVSVALPVFLSVIGCEFVFPTTTFPKLTLDALADTNACKPVPVNEIGAGELAVLLPIETAPLTAPRLVGENLTSTSIVFPGPRFAGAESPLKVKPAPETIAGLMATFSVPLFVRVRFSVFDWPTGTFGKFSDPGETFRPGRAPVPCNEILSAGSGPSLLKVIAPAVAPNDAGANCNCRFILSPAATAPDGIPPRS